MRCTSMSVSIESTVVKPYADVTRPRDGEAVHFVKAGNTTLVGRSAKDVLLVVDALIDMARALTDEGR